MMLKGTHNADPRREREMTLKAIHDAMKTFNREAVPGSECSAWGDFVADVRARLGVMPWDEAEITVPGDMADYWLDVANGNSCDYDSMGARTD